MSFFADEFFQGLRMASAVPELCNGFGRQEMFVNCEDRFQMNLLGHVDEVNDLRG